MDNINNSGHAIRKHSGLKLILLFLFFNIHLSDVISQPTSVTPQFYNSGDSSSDEPMITIQLASLDLCDSLKHIYTKVNYNINYFKKYRINSINVRFKDRRSIWRIHSIPVDANGYIYGSTPNGEGGSTSNIKFIPSAKDNPYYFEMEYYNVWPIYDRVQMEVNLVNQSNVTTYTKSVTLSTKKEKDLIDVTDHMGYYLDGFMAQKDTSIMTYFCGKKISQIELLSFFQDYMQVSPERMCEIIKSYNIAMANNIATTNPTIINSHITTILTCLVLEEWEKGLTENGGGDDDDDDICLCKTIRTKADAASIGVGSKTLEDDCKHYTPKAFERHYLTGEWNKSDDDLILLSGKMGAAKGEMFYLYVDGGDKIPDNDAIKSKHQGFGLLTFRSVCVDPATLAIPITQCKNCSKEIEFQYNYSSNAEIFAKEWNNVFYDEKVGITMEEFATLIIENDGQVTIADTLGYKLLAECDAEQAWNLDTLLNKGLGLYEAIEGISGIAGYVQAAQLVVGIIQGVTKPPCGKLGTENKRMSGTKTYILKPGQRFNALLYSESLYKGRGQSSVMGWATLLSDYYMTAVLKTIPDSTGKVPDYCACEAIASYTWGSMDGHSPSTKRPRDNDKQLQWPDFQGLYDDAPIGEVDIKQLIGSFIGTAGEWGDKFEKAGCCSVVIPCHADCVYLVGCENNVDDDHNRMVNHEVVIEKLELKGGDLELRSAKANNTTDKTNSEYAIRLNQAFTIAPNPATNTVNVKMKDNFNNLYITKLELYDISGQKLRNQTFSECAGLCNYQLDIETINAGTYLIRTLLSDGSVLFHRVVKL